MTSDITTSIVSSMHPAVSSLKTANYTITNGDYFVGIGTLTSNITITLPASPTTGDQYIIKDVNGTVGVTYTVTIFGNGLNIDGQSNFILAHKYSSVTFVFTGTQWSVCLSYAGEQNGNGVGLFANRPQQGQAGRTYLCTDTSTLYYDDGISWKIFGQLESYSGLSTSEFTWQNQNSATSTDVGNSIMLYAPSNGGGQNLRFFYKSVPSTPYTITAKFVHVGGLINGNASMYGLAIGDGTKLITLHSNAGDTVYDLNVAYWDGVTTYNSNAYANNDYAITNGMQWFRFKDDGTNLKAYVSRDGVNFINIWTASRTAFLTPSRIGMVLNPFNGDQYTACVSWKVE